ncbi:hypothetical protein [Fusobacterium animalis]|jgi:hypothetical protein
MLNKSIITLFGVDLYYMDILLIITIFLYASVALIKFDESSEDKEIRKKILFRRFLVIMCLIGIYLNTVDRKIRNENKVNVNQIIVLDKEAINDDRSFIYLVTEEFKTGADIVVLMPQNYNKEKLYNLAEQYNYKILTKDTMEVRYDKEVKGIENDRIIFRKNR